MIEEGNVVVTTAETIVKYNFDSGIDILEIGIDAIFSDSVLKEIPLVKTVYGFVRTGMAVREKHLLKNTLLFINKLEKQNISNEKYLEYKNKLSTKDSFALKELEHIIIILDRIVSSKKAIILANLYSNYINLNLTWKEFEELSAVVDGFYLNDIQELKQICEKNRITMNEVVNRVSLNRLKSQSLIMDIEMNIRMPGGDIGVYYNEFDYKISELGRKLYMYGIIADQSCFVVSG